MKIKNNYTIRPSNSLTCNESKSWKDEKWIPTHIPTLYPFTPIRNHSHFTYWLIIWLELTWPNISMYLIFIYSIANNKTSREHFFVRDNGIKLLKILKHIFLLVIKITSHRWISKNDHQSISPLRKNDWRGDDKWIIPYHNPSKLSTWKIRSYLHDNSFSHKFLRI